MVADLLTAAVWVGKVGYARDVVAVLVARGWVSSSGAQPDLAQTDPVQVITVPSLKVECTYAVLPVCRFPGIPSFSGKLVFELRVHIFFAQACYWLTSKGGPLPHLRQCWHSCSEAVGTRPTKYDANEVEWRQCMQRHRTLHNLAGIPLHSHHRGG